ncbi:response regulator transcription factor [Pseudoflavitalea sp. G-6-1-2]|uniref:response regulator n=1 Tax=Pseudoflavitalea sp. G-6-1-2 TaxID=2728841 RepID=UPI00146E04FD|nr:response regulator [Pseudoflavitalea sp. G-6-1-2]NML23759.1 response regulator transcription factor [Pseudoflavitalea sp. G-6-1-2]
MIRILIADDHDLYRDVLRDFLDRNGFRVIQTFRLDAGLEQMVDLTDLPDIAIIAFKSSRVDNLAGLRWLRENCPAVKILLTTLFDDRVPADDLKQLGIEGMIIKSHADTREIITALHAIQEGKLYY